jgi:uncharacterized protein with HEPN domain
MERDLNIYLEDALSAIEIIEGYTKKVDFKAFSITISIDIARR